MIALSLLVVSCDILRESAFEVASWSPGDGYHESVEEIEVVFSHESDRASVEHAFSLTQDGAAVQGDFLWQGKKLVYRPISPLDRNCDYSVGISTDAQDKDGLSFDRKFEARFTTRPNGTESGWARPRLVSITPLDGGILADREPVRLVFSKPISIPACLNSVSFSPSKSGSWRIEDGNTAVFTPPEPWENGVSYKITVSSGFEDVFGLSTGKELVSRFSIGADTTPPEITAVYSLDKTGNRAELLADIAGSWVENAGWESYTRLEVCFSEKVDVIGAKNRIAVEPAATLAMEADGTATGFADSVILAFSERPEYGSRFLFRVTPGIKDMAGNQSTASAAYRVCADGPYSKPPSLAGIRLPRAPSAADKQLAVYAMDQAFSNFILADESGTSAPLYETAIPFFIELYFDVAKNGKMAAIDIISLMDAFSVSSTNNALSFSPRLVIGTSFTVGDPAPGWESYCRVEVRGYLTNHVNSGVITFQIAAGLSDTFGNKTESTIRLPLLK